MMLRRVDRKGRPLQEASAETGPGSQVRNRRVLERVSVERPADLCWKRELEEYRLPVRVFDRSPGGIGLSLPRELPIGLLADLYWNGGACVQGVVRHCRPTDSQFVAGLMHLPVQRRAEERRARHQAAKLIWDDLLDGRIASRVQLLDVSSHGFRCRSPRSLAVPLVGCLATTDWQYYGTTRYCLETESGYLIGFQLIRAELSIEPGALFG